MQVNIVSKHYFEKYLQQMQATQDQISNLQGLAEFHRAVVIENHKEAQALMCFIPTYMINDIKDEQTRKYVESLQQQIEYPLVKNTLMQYKQAIIVPYIKYRQNCTQQLLYYAAVQSYFKQTPLVVYSSQEIKIDNVTVHKLKDQQYLIFPDDIKPLLSIQQTNIGPFTVTNKHTKEQFQFHLLIADQFLEHTVIGFLFQQSYNDESTWVIGGISQEERRKQQFQLLGTSQVQDKVVERSKPELFCKYGFVWLFVDSLNICNAKGSAICSPPGCREKQWAVLEPGHLKFCGDVNNHMFCDEFVVANEFQSMGVGSVIMKVITQYNDHCNAYMYLENGKPKLTEYYHSFGFQIVARHLFINQDMKVDIELMRRAPNQKNKVNLYENKEVQENYDYVTNFDETEYEKTGSTTTNAE